MINLKGKNDTINSKDIEIKDVIERGKYLVTIMDCNICHSPKIFNAKGFEFDENKLNYFLEKIYEMKYQKYWVKQEIVNLFNKMISNFNHLETNKYLDSKM